MKINIKQKQIKTKQIIHIKQKQIKTKQIIKKL
jgi:hypothetical protein